jgi:hypothetical protein
MSLRFQHSKFKKFDNTYRIVDDEYKKTNIEATFNTILNHDLVAETSKKKFRFRAKSEYEEMTFLDESDLFELDVKINRNQATLTISRIVYLPLNFKIYLSIK